jgi:hypothetical protein
MNTYIVLYHYPDDPPADSPWGFRCQADDFEHAEEQCLNAYPDADIVWVVETADSEAAYADYWNNVF